jgi:hypothetical protein
VAEAGASTVCSFRLDGMSEVVGSWGLPGESIQGRVCVSPVRRAAPPAVGQTNGSSQASEPQGRRSVIAVRIRVRREVRPKQCTRSRNGIAPTGCSVRRH